MLALHVCRQVLNHGLEAMYDIHDIALGLAHSVVLGLAHNVALGLAHNVVGDCGDGSKWAWVEIVGDEWANFGKYCWALEKIDG